MIHRSIKYLGIFWITLLTTFSYGQKVGVVLSGGGATGMAHIGVLMALEEHGIPIDYITGTSAGALVGSLYASGYSPKQIHKMINSPEFLSTATGEISIDFKYYFNKRAHNPSIVDFKFDRKLKLASSLLPINFTDPSVIDFFMIETFSIPSGFANYNFDSLLIPFRCVASDIDNNKEVVFSKGNLSQAVRTSMTFPFYIPPLKVDGKILVDGGLYNNFPADVMCNDFIPDVIIGSSVSQTRESPDQYDLLSQLRSMIQTKSNFKIECTNSIIIEPEVSEIGTFDFESVAIAILKGYQETIEKMDSIKSMINRRTDTVKLAKKRMKFLKRAKQEIVISNIVIDGVNKKENTYLSKVLFGKKDTITLKNLKKNYFRLITDDKIKFMFPSLTKNTEDNYYTMKISVKNQPEFNFKVGGFFSSRPNNTGYLGFDYKNIGRYVATNASSQFYFGKFYNSIDLAARFDFPLNFPLYIEPFTTFNQWDYFRSRSTFFEDNKPAYLIKNEAFFGVNLGLPYKNKGKVNIQYKNGFIQNEYYQTDHFLSTDTTDISQFFFNHINLSFEKNSLDNLYYSNKGTKLKLNIGYVNGIEINKPGSTSLLNRDSTNRFKHEWFQFSLNYEHYFECNKKYSLGIDFSLVHTSQDFFNNYSASILQAPQFSPIPETKTLFIPEYASHTYSSLGMKNVFNLYKAFDLRVEGYAFLPYTSIINENQKAKFTDNITQTKAHLIGSAILVYKSPIGPFSFTANYFDARDLKWSFLFNYNFVIFNRKALSME